MTNLTVCGEPGVSQLNVSSRACVVLFPTRIVETTRGSQSQAREVKTGSGGNSPSDDTTCPATNSSGFLNVDSSQAMTLYGEGEGFTLESGDGPFKRSGHGDEAGHVLLEPVFILPSEKIGGDQASHGVGHDHRRLAVVFTHC
jgi:hypothetical protein